MTSKLKRVRFLSIPQIYYYKATKVEGKCWREQKLDKQRFQNRISESSAVLETTLLKKLQLINQLKKLNLSVEILE